MPVWQVKLFKYNSSQFFDYSTAIRISENIRINKNIKLNTTTTRILKYFLKTTSKLIHQKYCSIQNTLKLLTLLKYNN